MDILKDFIQQTLVVIITTATVSSTIAKHFTKKILEKFGEK